MTGNDTIWDLFCAIQIRDENGIAECLKDERLFVSDRRLIAVADGVDKGEICGEILCIECDGVYGMLMMNTDFGLVTYEADDVFATYAWDRHQRMIEERFKEAE